MPTFKLARKLFKSQVRGDSGHEEPAKSSLAAQSSSTLATTTAQQPRQEQQPQTIESSSSVEPKQSPSFLSLPGEVRNLIYAYAIFPALETITIFHHADTFLALPIFHVSRQVRHEAVSYLCAAHTIYLSSLQVANDFFSIVGENGLRSLRHVTVRCAESWYQDSSNASAKKGKFVGYLKLARNLRCFEFVVGGFPLSREDVVHLNSAHSSGTEFLCAVKNAVDGTENTEIEVVSERRVDKLRKETSEEHGIVRLGIRHEKDEMPRDVFRLCKANGVVGEVADLELPSRLAASLQPAQSERTDAH